MRCWLEAFLARLPPGVRVVLTTREDPRLGLHRLRLAGELNEIRAPDLRFSLEETRAAAREQPGSRSRTAASRCCTSAPRDGPAGLRLAAISLAEHPDPERFVTEFSGSERTVAGYLLAEVLERQPPRCASCCCVPRSSSGSAARWPTTSPAARARRRSCRSSRTRTRSSPRLMPARSWFRYHHLFADLLRLELRRAAPASIAVAAPGGGPLARASTGTSSRRSATRRRRATGRWPRACSPTTTST